MSVRDCVKLINDGVITAQDLAKHFGKGTSYFHSHRLKKIGFVSKRHNKGARFVWERTDVNAPWDMNILERDFVKKFNQDKG